MTLLSVKSKIWLNQNNHMLLGEGRIELLKAIENLGSISKAAKSMKMSYAKAWKLVEAMNNTSKEQLVVKNSGGTGGGGTSLTEAGNMAIELYTELNQSCQNFLDKELKRITKKLKN